MERGYVLWAHNLVLDEAHVFIRCFFNKWFNLCVKSTRNPREHEIGLRACQGRVTNGDVSRSLPKIIHFRVKGGSLTLAVQPCYKMSISEAVVPDV